MPHLISIVSILFVVSHSFCHECSFSKVDYKPIALTEVEKARQLQGKASEASNTSNYNLTIAQELALQNQGKGVFRRMQIGWDHSPLNKNVSTSVHNYIFNKILPYAEGFFKSYLKVNPFPTKILTSKPSNNKVCGDYVSADDVDQKLFNVGYFGVDVLFIVKAVKEPNSNYTLLGIPCQYYQNHLNRPIIGAIIINADKFNTNQSSSLSSNREQFIHHMMHSLGFAKSFYSSYVDDSGKLRGESNVIKTVSGTSYIVIPEIVSFAKSYFGCSTLEGAPLENEGTSTSSGSHWQYAAFRQEIMNPQMGQEMRVSDFTTLMFRHMGWYLVNIEFPQPMEWAKGKGCSYLSNFCNSASQDETCATKGSSCSFDRSSIGNCTKTPFSNTCKVAEETVLSCLEKNTFESSNKDAFGMSFSDKSFCHDSNLKKSGSGNVFKQDQRCFKVDCNNGVASYDLVFHDGKKATCSAKDANITFNTTTSLYKGWIICSDPKTMCESQIKQRCDNCTYNLGYCANNNKCFNFVMDGVCIIEGCFTCINNKCVIPANNAVISNNNLVKCHYSCDGCTNTTAQGCSKCKYGFKKVNSTCEVDCSTAAQSCTNCFYEESDGSIRCKNGIMNNIIVVIIALVFLVLNN